MVLGRSHEVDLWKTEVVDQGLENLRPQGPYEGGGWKGQVPGEGIRHKVLWTRNV